MPPESNLDNNNKPLAILIIALVVFLALFGWWLWKSQFPSTPGGNNGTTPLRPMTEEEKAEALRSLHFATPASSTTFTVKQQQDALSGLRLPAISNTAPAGIKDVQDALKGLRIK